jgi:hypothetical protein
MEASVSPVGSERDFYGRLLLWFAAWPIAFGWLFLVAGTGVFLLATGLADGDCRRGPGAIVEAGRIGDGRAGGRVCADLVPVGVVRVGLISLRPRGE